MVTRINPPATMHDFDGDLCLTGANESPADNAANMATLTIYHQTIVGPTIKGCGWLSLAKIKFYGI